MSGRPQPVSQSIRSRQWTTTGASRSAHGRSLPLQGPAGALFWIGVAPSRRCVVPLQLTGRSLGLVTDIVLVHGTTQSAAGFAGLVDELADLGHRVFCPEIQGGTATTAAEYAQLIGQQLPTDVHRPVVAAHSAAGLLLPALARRLDASHQVWLAAAVADYRGGRSLMAEIQANPAAVFNPEWLGVDPTSDPVLATYFLFHDADLATLQAALPTVARCDLQAIYHETPTQDPARLPSTYVLPTDDRASRPDWMQTIARERLGVEPDYLPGGHNCYVALARQVARLVDAAAASHR
jgi:hypothetical protein